MLASKTFESDTSTRSPQKLPRCAESARPNLIRSQPRGKFAVDDRFTTTSPCTWATTCDAESRAKSLCPVTMLQEDGE